MRPLPPRSSESYHLVDGKFIPAPRHSIVNGVGHATLLGGNGREPIAECVVIHDLKSKREA